MTKTKSSDDHTPSLQEVKEVTSYYLPEQEVTEILDLLDGVGRRTSTTSGHSRLAFAVIVHAFFDATGKTENEQARSFLLNKQRRSMLPFWCQVAELPVDCVVSAAQRLADDGWKRPAGGHFLKVESDGE